jgi:hypothetical protein
MTSIGSCRPGTLHALRAALEEQGVTGP